MATQKTVIEVDVQGTERVESMRTQMRKLREELARLPEGTEEFNRVQRQLGQLKDQVDDLGRGVNTLAGDPLERLNNSFGMIGSSILSLDFGAAQTGIKGISSAINDVKLSDLSDAAKGFASSIGSLVGSLVTNPFALIAGGAALVITQYDTIIELMTQVTEDQKQQREIVAETAKAFSGEAVELQKLTYEIKNNNLNQEQRNKVLANLQKKYPEYLGNIVNEKTSINDLNIALEKVNKALILKYEIQAREKSIQPLFEERLNTENKIAEAEKNRLDRQNKILQKEQEARRSGGSAAASLYQELDVLKNVQDDTVERLKVELQGVNDRINKEIEKIGKTQLSLDALTVKSSEQKTEKQKVENHKQLKQEEKHLIDRKKLLDDFNAEQDAADIELINQESLKADEKLKKTVYNEQVLGETKLQFQDEYDRLQAQIALENADKLAQDLLKAEKAFQDAKYSIAADAVGGLMDLNSALVDSGVIDAKKGFNIAKTLGIAQATISTIEGTQNAFTTASASPITTAFPAYPFIQAGIAAAAGIARIASIRAQQFNGGGGGNVPKPSGGGGGVGGGTTPAPAVDLSFLNKGGNKSQPLQAYVLATNVSTAQEAEQKIKDQSRIIK